METTDTTADDGCPLYFVTYLRGKLNEVYGDPAELETAEKPKMQVTAKIAHAVQWKRKADKTSREFARISSEIIRSDRLYTVSLERLAAAISMGYPVLPGICESKRKPEYWVKQQLFFVDIDNDEAMLKRTGGLPFLDMVDAVQRAFTYELPLVLSYESFNSPPPGSDKPQRYRLVFAKDKLIEDKAEAVAYGESLLAAFPEADPSCIELNRLFLGTDKEVLLWANPWTL